MSGDIFGPEDPAVKDGTFEEIPCDDQEEGQPLRGDIEGGEAAQQADHQEEGSQAAPRDRSEQGAQIEVVVGDRVYHRQRDLFARVESVKYRTDIVNVEVKYEWPCDPKAPAELVPITELSWPPAELA